MDEEENTKQEITKLEKMKEETIWKKELTNLLVEYEKYRLTRIKLQSVSQKIEKKTKVKRIVKK
jgi:hypothetical protein